MGKGGEPSDQVDTGSLHADAAYAPFLQDDFDATEFASNALSGSHTTAQAQTRRLQDQIQGLQISLREEVLHRRPEVLQQAAQLRDTESAMQGISLAIDTMQSALQGAKALIMDLMSNCSSKLSNSETCMAPQSRCDTSSRGSSSWQSWYSFLL